MSRRVAYNAKKVRREAEGADHADYERESRVRTLWAGARRRLQCVVDQAYFRQRISGTKDNKATPSVVPTMLLRECGPNDRTPAPNNPAVTAPSTSAGPEI